MELAGASVARQPAQGPLRRLGGEVAQRAVRGRVDGCGVHHVGLLGHRAVQQRAQVRRGRAGRPRPGSRPSRRRRTPCRPGSRRAGRSCGSATPGAPSRGSSARRRITTSESSGPQSWTSSTSVTRAARPSGVRNGWSGARAPRPGASRVSAPRYTGTTTDSACSARHRPVLRAAVVGFRATTTTEEPNGRSRRGSSGPVDAASGRQEELLDRAADPSGSAGTASVGRAGAGDPASRATRRAAGRRRRTGRSRRRRTSPARRSRPRRLHGRDHAGVGCSGGGGGCRRRTPTTPTGRPGRSSAAGRPARAPGPARPGPRPPARSARRRRRPPPRRRWRRRTAGRAPMRRRRRGRARGGRRPARPGAPPSRSQPTLGPSALPDVEHASRPAARRRPTAARSRSARARYHQ